MRKEKETTSLRWLTPIDARKTLGEFKSCFPPAAFIRIALASTVVFIAARYALLRRIPELEVDWLELYLKGAVSAIAIFACCFLIAFLPEMVTVNKRGIMIHYGSSVVFHYWTDIASINMDADSKPFPLLKITFFKQQPVKEYPISPKIPLDRLAALIDRCRFGR